MAETRRAAEELGYERRGLDVRKALLVAAALIAGLVGIAAGLYWLVETIRPSPQRGRTPAVAIDEQATPQPRLHAELGYAQRQVQQRARARLNAAEWIDREAGLARIPIEDAMALLAERGWPKRQGEAFAWCGDPDTPPCR